MFFYILFLIITPYIISAHERAPVGELFTKRIEPYMFNWTHQGIIEQFRYRPSLQNKPDLPSWLKYQYSNERHAGFLYGTPPESLGGKEINLDIVALNRQNFETRHIVQTLYISPKFPSPNVIQMKIDNLNWTHLMDPGRIENLKNIFRKDLWPESQIDLNMVFMESAINMGSRYPLQPQQTQGVIVHLGSSVPFSERLKELQEEVRPLYKLATCNFKRTSVQKIFENVGFKLDWCAFKILGNEITPEILYHNQHTTRNDRWIGISKDEAPQRNYIDEFAFAFLIPAMIFTVLLGALSAVLCFHHEKLYDSFSELYFQNIFHICEDYWREKYHPQPQVQMVQHLDGSSSTTTTNQPTTTLKSLKDPNLLIENTSTKSQSPSNSLYRNNDGIHSTTLRPHPPPYKGSSLGRSNNDISTRVLYC